jgi:hypothetical protein
MITITIAPICSSFQLRKEQRQPGVPLDAMIERYPSNNPVPLHTLLKGRLFPKEPAEVDGLGLEAILLRRGKRRRPNHYSANPGPAQVCKRTGRKTIA